MKKLIPHSKLRKTLLLVIVLFVALLLTGCTKQSDATYFLRGVENQYNLSYQGNDNKNFVTSDLILHENFQGVDITWESSHPEYISIDGKVNLPPTDLDVTLTANFEIENQSSSKQFVVTLISNESIENSLYNDANTKLLLFETRNNDNNYQIAKEALELVNPEHPEFQILNSRFLVQEEIRFTDDLVKDLESLPTTAKFNFVESKVLSLPQENAYVTSYQNILSKIKPYLPVGDSVGLTIDEKTPANYDSSVISVEEIEDYPSLKANLNLILNNIKSYLDDVVSLESDDLTQEGLKSIITKNYNNSILNDNDLENLRTLFNLNQTRLFNLLPDLGQAHIAQTLDSLNSNLSEQNIFYVLHLINNYQGLLKDEFYAQLRIISLSFDNNLDTIGIARDANNLVISEEIKVQNETIISDFERVLTLQDLLPNILATTDNLLDYQRFYSAYDEIKGVANLLLIDANIDWFNQEFAQFEAIKKVLDSAADILDISIEHNDTTTHPILGKITEAKTNNNDRLISENRQISSQLLSIIEDNIMVKLFEVRANLEEEVTVEYRQLLGQLLAQVNRNNYDVYQLETFRDQLVSDNRLEQSSSIRATIIIIFIAVVILLVLQAMTADYASKKGYEGVGYSLIALIPIGGFIYFWRKPKRRNISKSGFKQVYRPQEIVAKFVIYAQIVAVTVIVLVPIIYIFGMAFSDMKTDIPNQIWPDNPSFNAFKYLFQETKFKQWWLNTVSIALVNMLVGTVLITGAAYVFARFNFKGKKAGLLTILVLQSFPSFMGLIAMYVLFWKFGMLGRPIYLTILYIGGGIPGNIWLIKGFLDQIPRDLDESAMIDGANKLQIFFRIIMPLAIPILTFVAVNMFMAPWMDYMLPGYLLNIPHAGAPIDHDITTQWTLAVGLFKLINDPNTLHYSAFAAGALIVGIPITLLYMFFQKYLIEGIMAGATKG